MKQSERRRWQMLLNETILANDNMLPSLIRLIMEEASGMRPQVKGARRRVRALLYEQHLVSDVPKLGEHK